MKWAMWAGIVCSIMVAWWLFRMYGQPLDPPTERDRFFYGVATQFRQPSLCAKISRYAEGSGGGWDRPGYQISYLQSDCYFNLAGGLGDPSLCDRVRPISKGSLDGSKYNPETCRAGRNFSSTDVVDADIVVAWMRRLGYTDLEFYRAYYRNGLNTPIYKAYERLKEDDEFAKRIAAAPSFDEPIATANARAPNDLEYLYALFASDANDSSTCGKISPGAMLQLPVHRVLPLRLDCYDGAAFSLRDVRLCEKLPSRANLPTGATDYISRESCSLNVEVQLRDPKSRLTAGPGPPPTFESFKNALQQVGYDLDLPQPTASDYEDFLIYLAHQDTAGRAEFLRRVAALE